MISLTFWRSLTIILWEIEEWVCELWQRLEPFTIKGWADFAENKWNEAHNAIHPEDLVGEEVAR